MRVQKEIVDLLSQNEVSMIVYFEYSSPNCSLLFIKFISLRFPLYFPNYICMYPLPYIVHIHIHLI